VVVLLAEDTRDEAYFWISKRREEEMAEELRTLKGVAEEVEAELGQAALSGYDDGTEEEPDGQDAASRATAIADGESGENAADGGDEQDAADGQAGLTDFDSEGGGSPADEEGERVVAGGDGEAVEVVADQREMDASIARELSTRDGVEVRLETLAVGDYVLSDRVVVERKTVADFLDTLTGGDRSLFEQVGDAARHYARPVVVLEGEGLYERRNVHPNAIRGALASLAVDFGASVLQTADEDGTTELLESVATREQAESDREVSVHGEKAAKTLAEQQEYVVSAIADIGPVTARSLLDHFGSVEAVLTAGEEDLLAVEGVGEVTAERIREVVGSAYDR
jgi:Fanconi anemia group M protein